MDKSGHSGQRHGRVYSPFGHLRRNSPRGRRPKARSAARSPAPRPAAPAACVSCITLALVRLAWPLMLSAATVRPARSTIGAAIEIRPSSSSWLTRHQPWRRACSTLAKSASMSVTRVLREGFERRGLEPRAHLLVVQVGQQQAAHRRAVGRQARAHAQADAHDLVRRHAHHVDDVGGVQHRGRARLLHLLHQRFHHRLGAVPDRHRREVGKAQVEDARRQREELAVALHIAQRLQREQDAARAGAREAAWRPPPRCSVWRGALALKERITCSPRAKDCT